MLKSIWNSRSGLYANQNRIDTISNNIANVNTNGYKRLDTNFSDIVSENINRLGVPLSNDDNRYSVGSGTRVNGYIKNSSQGNIIETNNKFDFAIEGEGYFRLVDRDGNYLYTRNGSFKLDSNNNLVDSNGNRLDLNLYTTDFDINNIEITEHGQILNNNEIIGNLKIYNFVSEDQLQPVGNSLFRGVGATISTSKIKQGYLESSNVDIAKELTDLMITQRAFEMSSRALKSSDEMWQITNNIRGR